MIQTESRKGTECLYKPIHCVEGFCQDCQIYKDFQGHQKTMGRISSSIYPIDSLKKQIATKRETAFAEAAFNKGGRFNLLLAMVDAYDVVLELIDKGEK